MSWKTVFSVAALGLCLSTASLLPLASAQDENASFSSAQDTGAASSRKLLYLFTTDFPHDPMTQYPSPPVKETRFWQLLDKEMANTSNLTLTENVEEADYRIELRCGGVVNCSKLLVDVKDPHRTVLTSFTIKNVSKFWGLGPAKLPEVAYSLSQKLDERIKLLDKGGYGHTD